MNFASSRRTLARAALVVAAVNGWFLLGHARRAWSVARQTAGISDDERRLMMWGPLYAQLLAARKHVPETATLWWVSPEYPWLVNYFLYPRTLRWGSRALSEARALHEAHPADWVVGYSEAPGARFGRLDFLAPERP